MGGFATYDFVVGLRAVTSTDGMTADFYPFDMSFIGAVATRIINEVKGVNRVVYDVTSKPPGTIEWERCVSNSLEPFRDKATWSNFDASPPAGHNESFAAWNDVRRTGVKLQLNPRHTSAI